MRLGFDFLLGLVIVSILLDSLRSTSIIASGQIMAHSAQPVHSELSVLAGKKPFLLDLSEIVMLPLGHAITHRPQPLHRSILIIILPAIRINTHKLFYCFFQFMDSNRHRHSCKDKRALIPVSYYLILNIAFLMF